MLLVVPTGAQPAFRGQGPDAGQMAVELGGEEPGPPHLAVADDVDAGRTPGRGSRRRPRRRASRRDRPARTRRVPRRRCRRRTTMGGRASRRRSSSGRRSCGRPSIPGREGEDAGGVLHEEPSAGCGVDAALVHGRAEPIEQPGQARASHRTPCSTRDGRRPCPARSGPPVRPRSSTRAAGACRSGRRPSGMSRRTRQPRRSTAARGAALDRRPCRRGSGRRAPAARHGRRGSGPARWRPCRARSG